MISFCAALPEKMKKDVREVSSVHCAISDRRQGHATKLMQEICADADTRKMVLVLVVQSYGAGDRMSDLQLIEWYDRFGFRPLPNGDTVLLARMFNMTPKEKQ